METPQVSTLRVTKFKGTFESGKESEGFVMNGYLASNLLGVPAYLKKKWDVVGIVSGHGKVRVGKSTMAFQVATFLAWLNAGGMIYLKEDADEHGKKRFIPEKIILPKQPIRFNLYENVVFSAVDLKKKAKELYDKYGKNQIIIYDEAREGLEGARAMENLNKVMQDFFQECGFMGMIILLVLPNFFKLHEDYAVSRSIFLIDCMHDKKKRRGYFNFYNETQKEWLYFMGKKRIGITMKYGSQRPTFWGKFTSWFPFDRNEYERLKAEALQKRGKTKKEKKYESHRNALAYYLNNEKKVSYDKLSEIIKDLSGEDVTDITLMKGCDAIEERLKKLNKI